MGSDWECTTVGELVSRGVIARPMDGNHGEIHPKSSDFQPTGIPFITAADLCDGRLDLVACHFISPKLATTLRKGFAKSGDVLLTHKATLGRTAIVPPLATPYIVLTPQVTYYRVLDDSVLNARYLRFYFDSPKFQNALLAHSTGSTRGYVSITRQNPLPVVVPPIQEQRAIACILGALDDKIELNRRMNETLETMERALFKSWFVDFDPVRAKAEGQQPPGLAPHIADLFPDAFEESELGEIPKGWEVGVVSDLGNVVCGKTPPTKDPENYGKDIPFITIPDMHDKVFVTQTAKYLSERGANTQRSKYLPAKSICVSCIATPGLVVMTTEQSQTNQQINSIIPKDEQSSYYCFQVLKRLGDQIRVGGSGGSVLLNLNKTLFSNIKILIPDRKTIEGYQQIVEPFFEKLLQNQRELTTLAALRDTLLPKLISGELRVPDAERIVGRCV